MMRILIGYDGSDCADAALDDLQRAGLTGAHEALVISVAEQWLPPPPPSSYEVVDKSFAGGIIGGVIEAKRQAMEAVEAANALGSKASKAVQTLFPAWTVQAEAYSGSPAGEILQRAEEWEADLIVVGSHGRSALGRLILGSVSQRVVTDATCSVRVARRQPRETSPVRIIIGVDGSPGSATAVQSVAARAWPRGSEVRLVTSVDPLHEYAMAPDDKFAFVRAIHQTSEATLRASGLQVASLIEEEDPKHLLIAHAAKWNADCIFVGARGLSRLGRILLGSVSTAVVSRAHCSVEVARGR